MPGNGGNGRPPGGGNGKPAGGGIGIPPGPGGNGGRPPRPAPAWPGGAAVTEALEHTRQNTEQTGNGRLTRHPRGESTAGGQHRRRAGHSGERRRRHAAGEAERRRECAWRAASTVGAGLVLRKHGVRVGLAFGGVGRRDAVNNRLGLLVSDLLVVVDDVAQVVSAAVVRLAHAHRVVRQVHIAVVAEDCRGNAMLALTPETRPTMLAGQGEWKQERHWSQEQQSSSYISAFRLSP